MTTADLRIPGDVYRRLHADVAGRVEWAGYLLCGTLRVIPEILLGREWCPVPAEMQLAGTGHGFSWNPDFDVQMLNRMQKENLSALVFHYHGGTRPGLSGDDTATADTLMPFLSAEVPGRSHGFVVLGDRAASGPLYRDGKAAGSLGSVRVVGTWLDDWTSNGQGDAVDERHDRLVRGFGSGAYRRLKGSRVGVVGCGGGASHVIQQLGYLGVGHLVLADADLVELTNLNRLIGALPGPAKLRFLDRILRRRVGDVSRLKVEVMTRLVRQIDPGIEVSAIPEFFPAAATVEAFRYCDILVGCVDRLQVRDDLNRLSKRYEIPLVDLGIEITPKPDDVGKIEAISGRVSKVLPSGPCLRCQGVIDDEKLAEERDGQPLGYTGAARVPDPAVVTLNGVVGSIAATEVLQLLTGFAQESAPNAGWIYNGLSGLVERVAKQTPGCDACRYELGMGDI